MCMILKNKYEKNMTIKTLIIYAQILVHIFVGLICIIFFPILKIKYRNKVIKFWCSSLLKIISVKVSIKNFKDVRLKNVLFMANHISWLDIILINSIKPSIFVAKSSVRNWPIFGLMASACNTIFLNRSSRNSILEVTSKIKKIINTNSVFIFPEGTSTYGIDVGKFHSNFFQVAVDLKKSIYPVCICYRKNNIFTDIPGYVGDDTLIESIVKIVNSGGFEARITFCKKILSKKFNRKELALKTQEIIKSHLNQD